MITKNAKRLWPVPATLAVMAVVAFLAFGLMVTTGAQPAAAQDDPDCTIDVGADTGTPTVGDVVTVNNTTPETVGCKITGNSVVIALPGSLGTGEGASEETAWVYAKNGTIVGGTSTSVFDHDVSGDNDTNQTTRFSGIVRTIPKASPGAIGGGGPQRSTVEITVSPDSGKSMVELYIFYGATSPIPAATESLDGENGNDLQINNPTGGNNGGILTVTFLSAPAVGKDGADYNPEIDDVIRQQCRLTDDTIRMRLVGEAETCTATNGWVEADLQDAEESRSKLVAFTSTGTQSTIEIIDGKSKDHTLDNNDQTAVTIYARIEDATGNALPGADVTFNATVEPSDLQVDVSRSRTEDALPVVASGAVTGQSIDLAEVRDRNFVVGDAIASRIVDRLPTGKPFRITVEVSADGVPIGTIVITRNGDAEVLKAGVFNVECLVDNNATKTAANYADDNVDLKAKGCDDSGMASRFGAGDVIVVKAHLEDSLGSVVGLANQMDVALADDFDDPLDTEDPTTINIPIPEKDMPSAWVYVVDEHAQLGDHMITVSTTAKNVDDGDIGDVTLTVSVAGPPTQYMFVDLVDNIELGGRATFRVQAYDANNGAPHFSKNDAGMYTDNTVEVVVPDIAQSLVRGSELLNGVLTLDADTGMGTFTIYAPSNAADGSTARIFVSAGDVEITHTVTFGDPDATPDPMERDGFTADYTVTATSTADSGMVDVSWTRSEELSLSLVSLIKGDDVVDFTITVGLSTQFSGVDPGEYDVSVFSLRNNADGKDGEIAFGTVTVE